MNPLLTRLQPYPFERLRALTKDVRPNPDLAPISLGIGEPKHPTPEFLKLALTSSLDGLAAYPATAGLPALRRACAGWIERRYGVTLDADTEILPVNGSREALFSLAQTVIDPSRDRERGGPVIVCPNPFYQIYEGAAYLSGATPVFANSDPARNFAAECKAQRIWDSKQAVYKRALGRHHPDRWQQFLIEAGRVDRVSKGRVRWGEESADAWQQLERLLLAVADKGAARLLAS